MPISAVKALYRAKESGEAIPLPGALHAVEERGGRFRRGHVVLIGGASNSGKSSLAMFISAESNVPALYFAADQDAWTTVTKFGAILSDRPSLDVAKDLAQDDTRYRELLSDSRVHFVFDSNPTLADIELEIDAFVEIWDAYPDFIFIDNLVNIQGRSGEAGDDQFIVSECHGLARRTKSCVVLLVHVKEGDSKRNASWPPKKPDLLNQIQRLPDLIITVASDESTNEFRLAVVKTREGRADPSAKRPVTIWSDLAKCKFYANNPAPTPNGWLGWYKEDD
jgi:hypothetical protein